MQSVNAKAIVVFGVGGKGKSTLLNHLLQSVEDAQTDSKQLFYSSQSPTSGTLDVKSSGVKNIYGTDTPVILYDVPGVGNVDLKLKPWFEKIKQIPEKFDALLWVINLSERCSVLESMVYAALDLILENFDFDKNVIIAFTHCDTVGLRYGKYDEAASIDKRIDEWMIELKKTVKDSVRISKVIRFGVIKTPIFTPNYVNEFKDHVEALYGSQLSLAKEKFNKALAPKIIEKMDPEVAEDAKKIIKNNTCYSQDTLVYVRRNDQANQITAKTLNEVELGDNILTLNKDSYGDFRFEFEPIIIISKYDKILECNSSFIKFTVDSVDERFKEIKLHSNHYMHVLKDNQYYLIEAKDVVIGDYLYGVDPLTAKSTKPVRILNIERCRSEEIGIPINIRTKSLNLIVNNLWGSSRFNPDSGVYGHKIVCLASKIHPSAGQSLHNLTRSLKLYTLINPSKSIL